MTSYRIALADDHVIFRQGMKRLIESRPEYVVVGEANDGIELLQIADKVPLDMIILDVAMPNLRGIEAMHEIRRRGPSVKIVVLTMHRNKEYLHAAIRFGANGYLLKEDSDRELFAAIQTIRKGAVYITSRLRGEHGGRHPAAGKHWSNPLEELSLRERQIIKLVAEGKSNKEIGELLGISTRTAENHRAKVMRKLNLGNMAELIRFAIQSGLVELPG